jgi:hypothetical protein
MPEDVRLRDPGAACATMSEDVRLPDPGAACATMSEDVRLRDPGAARSSAGAKLRDTMWRGGGGANAGHNR